MTARPPWQLIFVLVTGCYTIQSAQREDLGPLQQPHDDHVGLFGPRTGTRVAPHSPVRFHFKDGGQSPWLSPERLLVNESGVRLESPGLPIDALARIEVKHLSDERRAQLAGLAQGLFLRNVPPRFEVDGPGAALRAWFEAVRAAELPASPEEDWLFVWRSDRIIQYDVAGLVVQRGLVLPDTLVDGARWDDIASLEVQHPDHGATVAFLIVVPLSLFVGGNLAGAVTTSSSPRGAVDVEASQGSLLWRPGRSQPELEHAKPLFTALARRRANYRGLVALEGGSTFSGRGSQASVFGGVRLLDVFEAGLGVHWWWPNLFAQTPFLSNAPLSPAVSKYAPLIFWTLRLGCNFDLDADRRVLVPVHLELGTDFGGHAQVRLAWGLQVRFFDQLFVALRPFNPQYTSGQTSVANWQFPTTLELGSAF